ncbi:aminoglycoside phosphotransferase family protein [Aliiruegeria sabulilitoris]|uniref:aminoglycoside phosphotransferase family protein n=1 Tax=Aliiruegeria sabulilitoris TaxID=1510458 RepID=UPI000830E44C|nr:phosphotransferase [Aliiruegeria sabulilitoris]NDR57553.1 phosphotransferase [Pseudoruegeria sp. M32A2M]
MTRQADRHRFLSSCGWGAAGAQPLAGDASARSYLRLSDPSLGTAVLMDAPPATGEDIRPFCWIARFLADSGLSAPQILAEDPELGFLLLEDFGDALFARLIEDDSARETGLYEAAVDVLVELHRHAPPTGLPTLGPREMSQAVGLVLSCYAAGAGKTVPADASQTLGRLLRPHLDRLAQTPPVLALRDFHAENLLWLPDRQGARRVGLLDFQDAFAGHPAYDLISLLEDARRDVSEPARKAALARFSELGGLPPEELALACATLGAQRNLRILGVFARLCMQFGKAHYIELIPRVWSHLQRDLTHPSLADIADFVSETLPAPSEEVLQSIREKCGTCPTP